MRRGMGERRSRRQDQRGKARPVHRAQVGGDKAGFCSLRQPLRAVIACDHFGATGLERMTARQPRAAEAEHRDRLARKGSDGDQVVHRSFNVERPASASITEMIQNRITICGSVQPSCSKWWWIGAILKMRLPVSLKEITWTMTETASSTNRPPITASTISCLVATATAPSMPPSASEPVSPMKIDAGGALNQRKPKPAPSKAPHTTASSPVPAT